MPVKKWDVTDAWNKHYSILLGVRRAKGAPRLKIEVRKEVAYRGSSEQKIAFSPHFPEQVLVRGFTLKQMLRNKVLALIDRGEVRDAFDIEFLVRKGIERDLGDEERKAVLRRLRGFNKKDFNVKLGSILAPELREYYKANRFAFLEEKLSFQNWK
jgi:hypothetical protein